MAVSNADVMKLRKQTGAGIMDCKEALHATDGDFDAAMDLLRKKGIDVAAKREGRGATEGVICTALSADGKSGALVEVNSETDFSARSDAFRDFATTIITQIAETAPASMDDLLAATYTGNPAITVQDMLNELTGKIGERIVLRRFERYDISEGSGLVTAYIHGGDQIGVLLEIVCDSDAAAASADMADFAKNVAMQVAAMQPEWISESDVPAAAIEREHAVLIEQAKAEGKPESIAEKMVAGRMKKFYSRVCLLNQPYIRDDKVAIEELVSELIGKLGEAVTIKAFVRYQVGEEL